MYKCTFNLDKNLFPVSMRKDSAVQGRWRIPLCLECLSLPLLDSASFLSFSSVQFSCSVVSDSLWPHGPQHPRPPGPSPTPRAYPNSRPLSRWCHPAISSSVVPFSCLQSFPESASASNESVRRIKWPKYWSFSFSISPSSEYSGLISFRIDFL